MLLAQTLANQFIKKKTLVYPMSLDHLGDVRGKTKIGLVSKTVPRMRTTNNPYVGKALKYTFLTGWVNFNYQKEVNEQRKLEGLRANFESLPRQWGEHWSETPFVIYKPKSADHYKVYLRIMVESVNGIQYRNFSNHKIPLEKIQPFLYEKIESARQGTETPIVERDYYVENILLIVLDGKVYHLQT